MSASRMGPITSHQASYRHGERLAGELLATDDQGRTTVIGTAFLAGSLVTWLDGSDTFGGFNLDSAVPPVYANGDSGEHTEGFRAYQQSMRTALVLGSTRSLAGIGEQQFQPGSTDEVSG